MPAELEIPKDAVLAARLALTRSVPEWRVVNALESAARLIVATELERFADLRAGLSSSLLYLRVAELRGEAQ